MPETYKVWFVFPPGRLLFQNTWKCTMSRRNSVTVNVSKSTVKPVDSSGTTMLCSFLILNLCFFSASPEEISLQQALHESVFSPGISASPPHRVALCWDKHCQLLPEVLGLTAKRVATWSAEEVRRNWKADALLTFMQHKHQEKQI